jgi:hypothetical protein
VTPPFDIDGGLSLALARAFSTATLMLAFGCILYARVFAPPALPPATKQRLRQFTGWAICSAVLGTLVWLVAQTLDLNLSIGFPDLEAVLAHTMFGHLLGPPGPPRRHGRVMGSPSGQHRLGLLRRGNGIAGGP